MLHFTTQSFPRAFTTNSDRQCSVRRQQQQPATLARLASLYRRAILEAHCTCTRNQANQRRPAAAATEMGCSNSKSSVKLTDEDVQFLMKNTNYSEKEIRDWYKGFQVDCPDGKLSREKFIEIYKNFFKGGNPEKFCQHVYRTFDEDGNGWIDFKEFLLAIGITTSTNPREKLKWAFKMYDVDGNGIIELDEMTRIIKALHEMLGEEAANSFEGEEAAERIKDIFEKMDTNNDNKVSLEEFLEVCNIDDGLAKLLSLSADV